MSQVWFVTGVSSGFGTEIALAALKNGHKVIGTVRSRQKASEPVRKIEAAGGKILELDVTNADACVTTYQEAEKIFRRVDVLCNNAGMSYLGALEDFTDDEAHSQMDVNVYGPLRLIRAALSYMRKRTSGTIVNITSIAGLDGLPSCAMYAASKFALEGLSESLSKEVAEHNIQVLLVEPGAFRTNFLGAFVTNNKATIDQYPVVKQTLDRFGEVNGGQAGDPVKAAQRIVEVVGGSGGAGDLLGKILRLPLGPDCVHRLETKIENLKRDLELTKEVAMSTNYED